MVNLVRAFAVAVLCRRVPPGNAQGYNPNPMRAVRMVNACRSEEVLIPDYFGYRWIA